MTEAEPNRLSVCPFGYFRLFCLAGLRHAFTKESCPSKPIVFGFRQLGHIFCKEAVLVIVPKPVAGSFGGVRVVKNAEHCRACACHDRAECAAVEHGAFYPGNGGTPAVGYILKDIVHPAHDAAEIARFKRCAYTGSVGVAAQLDGIKLAEKLRRGYRKIRFADNDAAIGQRRQGRLRPCNSW